MKHSDPSIPPLRAGGDRPRFAECAQAWSGRYTAIVWLWENARGEFVPFLEYDVEIRRVICTTNAIESINARYRRAVDARGHFLNEAAGTRRLYLTAAPLTPPAAAGRSGSSGGSPP